MQVFQLVEEVKRIRTVSILLVFEVLRESHIMVDPLLFFLETGRVLGSSTIDLALIGPTA